MGVAAASCPSWPVAKAANKEPQPQPQPPPYSTPNWTAEEVAAAALPARSITPRQSMLRSRRVHEFRDSDNEDTGDESAQEEIATTK